MELQREILQQTGVSDLPATFVFDYPSIAEMCDYLFLALPAVTNEPAGSQINPEASSKVFPSEAATVDRSDADFKNQPAWLRLDKAERKRHVEAMVSALISHCKQSNGGNKRYRKYINHLS